MQVLYDNTQLEAAAIFIATFGSHNITTKDAAIDHILRIVRDYAEDDETKWVQCGGVTVLFSREHEDVCELDFQVEPKFLFYDGAEDYEQVLSDIK